MIISVEILSPIWHNRTVGLNLMNVGPGDVLAVDITYLNKHKRRPYPKTFYIGAGRAHSYPMTRIHGAEIHYVPISDLSGSEQTEKELQRQTTIHTDTEPKNTITMKAPVFSQQDVSSITDKVKERKEKMSNFDGRPIIEAGVHMLQIKSIEAIVSEKKGMDILQVTFEEPTGKHRPIIAPFFMSGTTAESIEVNKSRMVEMFYNGFDHQMKEANTMQDLVDQFRMYQNHIIPVAVRNREKLITTKAGKLMKVTEAEYWYCGKENTKDLTIDVGKMNVPLSVEDRAKLDGWHAERNSTPPPQGETTVSAPATGKTWADQDDSK